uniref:Beta-1,4-N-acetylgalactosaminyltransferase n=1 Tax=Sinocyclocheilus rhinocerous TaxID=307959 RepID=A0A673G4L5_9TELE
MEGGGNDMATMTETHMDSIIIVLLEYKNVFICIYLCVVCLLQYKGMANLHIFEDWCGTSIAQLRKNLHYPLYPHNRTTVKKLAVSPSWTNYGLRIFGYIHPYTDGDFLFAVASDDNSEFWLSDDENPDNLKLRAYVGKTGREWTAPGEYGKYASQISDLIPLQKNNKYFFELIHKQNDKGTDHVEVAWRLKQIGNGFSIIDSKFISLYTNESSLKAADVNHIPQTIASHVTPLQRSSQTPPHGVDMLRADPRDSFHQVPLLDRARLLGVLPDCIYNPSYSIKGYPLMRYQGLQFVHLTYVYPNDYTRLTHMENDNKCFYHGNPYYLERSVTNSAMFDEVQKERHDLVNRMGNRKVYLGEHVDRAPKNTLDEVKDKRPSLDGDEVKAEPIKRLKHPKHKADEAMQFLKDNPEKAVEDDNNIIKHENVAHHLQITQHQHQNSSNKASVIAAPSNEEYNSRWGHVNDVRKEKEIQDNAIHIEEVEDGGNEEDSWVNQGFSEEEDYDLTNRVVYDVEVKWCQTFQAKPLDLHALRSDWIDLKCNVSGNLLLEESEALSVVEALMKKLNKKYPRQFSLERIVNIEKKPDYNRGSRYLLELELLEASGRHLRLVQYIYVKRTEDWGSHKKQNAQGEELKLCNPYSFYWNPTATVHFIIPVKNQARWVQQFISDMEEIYRTTGDQNFNVIITDYESTDMNVEQALQNSYLPRYQYLRLSGNFERSAGLQAGIDLITDDHSIVFLCDLHIHFPPGFIDTVRKHCVERHMAFAPIVMRLNCGATPLEPDGYWEVNGFGLLGIYKSDLDSIGGMNTKEFTDRWGGEDWELLDRILQGGLEVERLYLRNFFHHFHSKRGMWNRQIKTDVKGTDTSY